MTHTSRHRVVLGLVAAALGASVVVPTARAAPPDPVTQQVVVVADDGGVTTLEVTEPELTALRADPSAGPVVDRGEVVHPALAQSVPKVGAPSLWAAGQRGAGKVIVIIDTGVAPTFGGTLVGQACFAATQVGPVLEGYCGPGEDVPAAFDSTCFDLGVCSAPGDVFDPAAGRPCSVPPAAAHDCYHGTAVAAVAARHEPTPGVAPDAGVYAIRVFNPSGTSADLIDLMLALDHVRQLADAGMDIAAVNLSVATANTFPTACDVGPDASAEAQTFQVLFDQLLARGIANAVASGNSGSQGGVALPACVSNALSVGATDLDDELADFGNRGPTLDLLAPGVDEGNGVLDRMDIPGSPVTTWAGTSFAAPHVAGAFALLTPQYPKASPSQIASFLRATGVAVAEPATGATYRRLRLQAPAQALNAGVLFPATAPVSGTARSAIGDFDGDGHADVLAHAPGGAPDRITFGDDDWQPSARTYAVGGSYTPVVGQFHGATGGPEDILWYAPGSAADFLWVGAPSRGFSSIGLAVSGTYTPVVGDYDGDGYDDVLWYAAGSASDFLWYGGLSGFTPMATSVLGSYRVAVGDFDADGHEDLVFHGPNSVPDALWLGTATRGVWAKRSLSMAGSYTQVVGDVNGDGADDLVLYQPGAGTDSIWRGGPAVGDAGATGGFAPLAIAVNGTYLPVGGDVDGDTRADIIWYAPGPPADYVWFGQAAGLPTSRSISVSGTYTPLLGDLDADDRDEIVWFNSTSTNAPVWWSYVP